MKAHHTSVPSPTSVDRGHPLLLLVLPSLNPYYEVHTGPRSWLERLLLRWAFARKEPCTSLEPSASYLSVAGREPVASPVMQYTDIAKIPAFFLIL
ncbi:hypothetical protein GN956_G2702 [Arapaima gigas]